MDSPTWLWTALGATFAVYSLVGVLLAVRRHRRPISCRSPLMLCIGHWANFVDLGFLYQISWGYQTKSEEFPKYYTSITLVCHYLYFFPYLLRCYRLKFVFTLDKSWENNFFRKNIARSRQWWLLLILTLLMIPVIIVAAMVAVYPSQVNVIPESIQSSDVELKTESLYILVCFLEEVLFVVAVFQLRNINDDFKMTLELTIVCCLWSCNSAFSQYSQHTWWTYQCAARNWALMLISSLWPVCKSYQQTGFSEAITPEVANSLELVLQNEFTLNCFERFLTRRECAQDGNTAPEKLLEFWLECRIYRSAPSRAQADTICEHYFASGVLELPNDIHKQLKSDAQSDDPGESLFMQAQLFVFLKLKGYFEQFQLSSEYSRMMKEVTRQEIYINRLSVTSLMCR